MTALYILLAAALTMFAYVAYLVLDDRRAARWLANYRADNEARLALRSPWSN